MSSRRSRAVLIRVRQELSKRLERVAPRQWPRSPAHARDLLVPGGAHVPPGAVPLRAALAEGSDHRFPIAHLSTRPGAPPDAAAILDEARAILRGEWAVFGQPAAAFARSGDWCADPVDGRPYPMSHWTRVPYVGAGGDVKRVWELNRHHGIVRLAQGYHLTGEEAFAEEAVRLLGAWASRNPPGRGINWTSSLEVAFRAIAWSWVWQLTRRSAAWTEARTAAFVHQLWHHARYVERYDSVHHSPNTHLTGEALGLLYVGSLFPQLDRAARWRAFGAAILVEEIEHQFLEDGFHYERAVGYHRYHLEFYLHALLLLRGANEMPPARLDRLAARLRDGFGALSALVRPDGSWPVIGDEDGGSTLRLAAAPAGDLRPLLTVGAALFGEPSWRWGAPPASTALAWWLCDDAAWRALATVAPQPPAAASAVLPAAGYAVARDDWSADAWYCAVDVGPHGGDATGHAHTDLGHVEVSRGGTRLLADPGSLTYTGDPAHRAWHRSEAAHARPSIAGMPLAKPAGPFGWGRVAPTPTWEVSDDGRLWQCQLRYDHVDGDRRLTHERHVVLVRGTGVIVCDWLDVPATSVRWHWPVAAPRAELTAAPGWLAVGGLSMHWAVAPAPSTGPVLDERSFARSYSSAEAGTLVTVETSPTDHACGIACALDAGARPPGLGIDVAGRRCTVALDDAVTLRFERGRLAVLVRVPEDPAAVTARGTVPPSTAPTDVREVSA